MPKLVLTPELEALILADVSEGIPLAESCRQHDVGRSTVYDRKDANTEFAGRLARARVLGEDAIVDDILSIADTQQEGEIVTEKPDGVEIKREDMLGHRKLRIETRLKLLAIWNPARFGAKVDVTSGGDKLGMAETLAARRERAAGGDA